MSKEPPYATRFAADALTLCDRLAQANGSRLLWWATDLASRNRFESPLPPLLNEYAGAVQAMEVAASHGQHLLLHKLSHPVACQVQEAAPLLGWRLEGAHAGKSRDWNAELKTWRLLAADFLTCVRRMQLRSPKRLRQVLAKKDTPTTLIKTFAYSSSLRPDGFYDPFFGDLPEHLKAALPSGSRVVSMLLALGDLERKPEALPTGDEGDLLTLEDMLRFWDIPLAALTISLNRLLRPFLTPPDLTFLGMPASTLVRQCLRGGGWRIRLFQLLHRTAARRAGKLMRLERCLLTYEGNPWERMFLAGLRQSRPNIRCVGYQHAVVPPAALGIAVTETEARTTPLPDLLLTTGPTPQRLLHAMCAIPAERIRAACALRQSFPPSAPLPPGPFTVLVAFEGVTPSAELLRYVARQSPLCPARRFILRAHPALPLPQLRALAQVPGPLPPNVTESANPPLEHEIAACHAVLYWGTTVALEALGAGRAAVHLDLGQMPSCDPIVDFVGLRRSVTPQSALSPVLDELAGLPQDQWNSLAAQGRCQCLEFFTPPDDAHLNTFLLG